VIGRGERERGGGKESEITGIGKKKKKGTRAPCVCASASIPRTSPYEGGGEKSTTTAPENPEKSVLGKKKRREVIY